MNPEPNVQELSSAARRELLETKLRQRLAGAETTEPVSPGQRALWLLHQLAPASSAYNVAFTARVVSAVDQAALQRAFQRLVDRHDALRSRFPAPAGEPVRHTNAQMRVPFEIVDATGWSLDRVHAAIAAEIQKPFNLSTGPLLRVRLYTGHIEGPWLAATFHHIVIDGWSFWICLSELGELYRAAIADEPATLRPAVGAASHARGQLAMASGPEGARHLAFWKQHLGSDAPVVDLPTDHPRPPVRGYRGADEKLLLSSVTTESLRRVARESRATLQMAALTLFRLVLARYTGQADLTIGYVAAGRPRVELESVVGYLANPLPLRLRALQHASFRDLLQDTRDVLLEALDHEAFPFPALVDQFSAYHDPSRTPLFQVLFAAERAHGVDADSAASFVTGTPGGRMRVGDLEFQSLPFAIQQSGQFDLTLMTIESHGGLWLKIDYDTDLFDAPTIRRLAGHLRTLAEAAAAQPDAAVSALSLLTEAETAQLRAWNTLTIDYGDGCMHELVERQADQHPDDPAVVLGDARLTYRELNARSNELARYLRGRGVAAETPVALLVERSFDLIVGMLGILKAGGAFIPMDATHPAERLNDIFKDSHARVLVTQAALRDRIVADGATVVVLDRDRAEIARQSGENLNEAIAPDRLAYMIYTSGSTGAPKGVMLEHRGLWNVAREQQRVFKLAVGSRVLQFASLSFDSSIAEVTMALCSGAALHLAPREASLPGLPLLQTLRREAISIVTLPPSSLANLPVEALPALTTLMVAGEACPAELASRWAVGRRFINLYGPTEATIWASYADCGDTSRVLPIGRPLANTRAYILDADLQEVPVGIPGELYIGGAGVARGYVNQPQLTAARFVPDPFTNESGARLYKTGDLVRRGEDGQLYFLGRTDFQVKLRGFRIELEEIEAALCRQPEVHQAVASLREDTPGSPRIVGYVVATPGAVLSADGLRGALKRELPDYMVPAAVVFVDALPVNSSGKIDRLALPRPESGRHVEPADSTPAGAIEHLIANIWKEVLNAEFVGIDDNFFDIGGNSLLMARVHARVSEVATSSLSIVDMFQFPTVRALAAQLANGGADAAEVGAADAETLDAGRARLLGQARRRAESMGEGTGR